MSDSSRSRPRVFLPRASLMVAAALIGIGVSSTPQAQAANYYWDATGAVVTGGSGSWDTSSAFWSTTSAGSDAALRSFAADDIAIFTGTAGTATLTEPITIGGLVFSGADFTVTGNTLTLDVSSGAPSISVTGGNIATLSSIVAGSDGLTKTGNGVLKLTNSSNSYTGTTTISGGFLVISSAGALGDDVSAISILTANQVPSNTSLQGISGGGLVLDGKSAGFELARDINFEGRGPIGERSAAILSIGDNTLSGTLTSAVSPLSPATFRNSRINVIDGSLTLSGSLVSLGTSASTFVALGGVNAAGVANFNLTGVLSGSGSVEKSGAGTLFLNPSSVSGFTGTLRVGGSATGQQSSVRVTQASVGGVSIFGSNTGTTTSSVIDLNTGVLEFRTASDLNYGALSSGKNVYNRNAGILMASGAGDDDVGRSVTLGNVTSVINTTASTAAMTFRSRNGYGFTFGTYATDASTSTSSLTNTLTNDAGGNLTFTGNLTLSEGSTASRPRVLLIGGAGNTVTQGSVIGGSDTGKDLTKTGAGSFTILGVGTTVAGTVSIQGGAIIATDFRSLNNNTAAISLGNATTTGGNLIIGTATAATVAGLTTSKTITLNTTSGSNSIYASQTGANPVILNGAITKIAGATTGNLILGGTNASDNIINVIIPVETTPSTGGVTKVGSGTWVLNAANTYLGATTIQAGTLKLRATAGASDVIKAGAVTFSEDAVTRTAGGTLEFRGFLSTDTTETVGALTPTAGLANIVTAAQGNATTLTFASLGARGAGATVNYDPGASTTIAFTTAPAATNGIIAAASGGAAFQTFNEVDWAALSGSNVARYTAYTTTAIPTSGTTNANTNYSQSVSASTSGTASINTLKIVGGATPPTITLGGVLTLTAKGVLFDNSAGTATITGSTLGAAGVETVIITAGSTPANALTVNSLIGSTTGSLTKSGSGTLIVGGNNTFTGNVHINEGTLRLSGATATLGVNSTVGNITSLRQGATLDINAAGASQTIGIGALQGAGTITNSGGGASTAGTISLGRSTSTGTTIFSGVLQDGSGVGTTGVLNVTIDGTTARTQALLGQSTYTGVTTIATGAQVTVDVLAAGGSASGIGASSNVAANLVFNGSAPTLIYRGNNRIGSLNLGSNSATTDRLFTIAGAAAVLSSTVTNNNAIVWSNTGAIALGTAAAKALTLTGTSTGDNTLNPQLTDSGTGANITSLTKTGAGQWNLGNSNNTYTGVTTLNDGVLGINDVGALPSGSPLALTPTSATSIATLQLSGEFTRSLAASATAGSGTVTFGYSIASTTGGVGFAAHTTPLVVAIGGTGTPTALTWGSGGFVGTGGIQNLAFGSASALSSVDFRNAVDLGASVRTINVQDNANTGADYATMSGALTGTGGGLLKIGGGILRLTGANSYTGTTSVEAGTLVVSSLGGTTGDATTSVGAGNVPMNDANAIVLGNASTSGGILQYVGPGETSNRKIRLRGTTASSQIHADGSGSLTLENVAHDTTETGNKTLNLRGSSPYVNFITGQLSNNGAGVLSVTVDGGTAWVLTNSANNYTGATTVSAGALGIGHDTAIPSGSVLVLNNGNVFAHGGDRVLTNTLNLTTNATNAWLGDYGLTFNGANSMTGTGTTSLTVTTNNGIRSGKSLVFNGMTSGAGANRAWTIDGPGQTEIIGNFTTSTAFWIRIDKTGDGKLVLGTSGAGSNWNTVGGSSTAVDLDRGTLSFSANEAIPSAAGAGGLLIAPDLAAFDTATVDLNGTTQTVTSLTASTDGTVRINNSSATAAVFRFGANDSTVAFGTGVGDYAIENTGDGKLDIVKLGNTSATFTASVPVGNKGLIASEGGTFTVAGTVSAATGLSATGNSTLALTGEMTNPGQITSVVVGGGSTLSLLNGVGNAISNLTTLNLGAGTGTATINLNVGTGATDKLTLLTGGTLNAVNTVTFNLTDAGLESETTYTLLNVVDGGLTALGGDAMFIQGGTPGGFDSMTWSVTDTEVKLTTGLLITGALYWRGTTDATWNAALDNWSLNKDGTGAASSSPGAGTNVIFAWNDVGTAALVTTLEQNFKINKLVFEAGTTTPTSVTINPGTILTNRLEIAPNASTDGIEMKSTGPASVTIGANLRIGKAQTWNVAASSGLLTVSGSLLGDGNVTKSGDGKVILSAAADPGFNSAGTTTFTVSAGTLELTNSTGLGSLAAGNAASLVLSGGAFYYNNATAATLPQSITLSGGTLSLGGASHTYSGAISVASASAVNMADSNGLPAATVRNITLSGVVTGSGAITLDSNSTPSGGNQLGGNFVINNGASTWDGDLNLTRGTAYFQNVASSGTATAYYAFDGVINFNQFGRVIYRNVDNAAFTRTAAVNFAAAAVGELQADNRGADLANYTLTQSGAVNLNAGSIARFALGDSASNLILTGGVVLNGNASLSLSNGDADSLLTISGTGISGTGNLALNDEAGTWGVTSGRVAINAAGTFTGNTTFTEGILILGDKDALSNGSLTILGTSTLQAGTDLSGANAFPNATVLSAALTVSGTNNFTFGGVLSPSGADRTLTNSLTGGAALVLSSVNLAETAAAGARNLTLAGSAATSITSLVNNLQNNTLTNNLTTVTLGIGTIALSEASGTGRTLTLGGTGNTTVTGVISNINGVGGTAGTLAKSGAGTLQLDVANTYSGGTTLSAGTLLLGDKASLGSGTLTVSGASTLQAGTDLSGANAVANNVSLGNALTFTGNNSLQLSGPVDLGGATRTVTANGGVGATLTLSGPITAGAGGLTLTGNATGTGVISGGITMTGTSADFAVNSGTWTLTGSQSVLADDIIVTGASAILNLSGSSLVSFTAGTSNGLYARTGAVINLLSSDVFGPNNSGSLDFIILGDSAAGGSTLNMGEFNLTAPRLDIGNLNAGYTGDITGTGILTINYSGTDYAQGLRFFRGNVSVNLGGSAPILKQGSGVATLSGDNSGLTGATNAATRIDAGTLALDYSASNTAKLPSNRGLDMRGGVLTLLGNDSAPTSQIVNGLTLVNGGSNLITLTPGSGQDIFLSLADITRTVRTGTLRINLPSGTQSATNGVTTTTVFTTTPGYLTVTDATGTYFAATNLSGNLIPIAATVRTNVGNWLDGEDVTNTGGGYTGTTGSKSVKSITFNSATSGNVTVSAAETLRIVGGGVLVTSAVTAGTHAITGGSLASDTSELIFTHDGAANLNVASSIGGTTGITKTGSGAGALRLTNAGNSFTGTVNILSGFLQVDGGNAIGDTAAVVLADDQINRLTLLANETIGSLSGGSAQADLVVGGVNLDVYNLTINQSASGQTFAGIFFGSGTLTKNGAGDLTHTGNSSTDFTGNLVINQGSFRLAGSATGRIGSTAIFINGVGSELHLNHDNDNAPDRVVNTAVITLNNTAPGRGLALRTTHGSTRNETIGGIVLGAGHNVVLADNTGGAFFASLISGAASGANLTRNNKATTLVVGRNLGGVAYGAVTAPDRGGRISFTNAITGANAAVGGAGPDGSATASIFPYMIGQATSGAPATTDVGNSFVRLSAQGLRPLSTAAADGEYTFNVAGYDGLEVTTSNNVRFTVSGSVAAAAGGTKTINSLVIDSTAAAVTLTGPGTDTLALTSGAFLSTGAAANNTSLTGFAGVTTASNDGYTFFVTNNTFTLDSALTSATTLVKSGAGVLRVNSTGNLFTDVYLNQGTLLFDDLDKVNGTTGTLRFFGGIARLVSTATDDLSTKPWDINTGGGTIDVSFVTQGATFANGIDDTTPNSADTLSLITRSSDTAGQLTIQGASTFIGTVIVRNSGTGTITNVNGVVLNGTTNAAINGNLEIGDLVNVNNNFDAVVALGASDQIVDTATITFRGASGENGYFKLLGFNETVAGIIDTTANGVVENREGDTVASSGTLTLNSASDFSYNGYMRDVSTGAADANKLILVKQGSGNQTLSGGNIRHSGTTTISGGTLTLTDVTNWQSAITNNATLVINQTTSSRNQTQVISGSGTLIKRGAGTIVIPTATTNTYSGKTTIEEGVLSISATDGLGNSSATNTIVVANNATLQGTGANVDLGANRAIGIIGLGAIIEVTASNILTVPGIISGNAGQTFTKTGTGSLVLTATNTYGGSIAISAGNLALGDGSTTGSLNPLSALVNNATLTFNRSNTLDQGADFASAISGTGAVIQAGAGVTILDGTNTYSGATTISAGTLRFAKQSALYNNTSASWTAANLIVNSGATAAFNVGGAGEFTSNDLDIITQLGASETGFRSGSTLALDTTNAVGSAFTYASDIANTNAGANSIGLTKLGAGTLTLSGNNSYTGATTVSQGILSVGSATALGTSAAGTTVTGGASGASSLRLQGGITVTGESLALTVTSDTTGNAALVNASGNNFWTGNVSLDTGTDNTFRARFTSDAGLLTVSGNISFTGSGNKAFVFGGAGDGVLSGQISGALPLFKDGVGTWTLSGDNSAFSGVVTVGNGVLEISSESNLGATPVSYAAAQLTLGSGASNQGTLRTSANTSLSANRGVTLASGGGAFDVADATTLTVGSVITGAAALAKSGAGNLVLSVGNSYSGATSVTQGVLTAAHALSLGTSAGATSVTSGAELRLQDGITIASEAVTLNGGGISSNGALRNLSGDNSLGGAITLASASRINSDAGTLALTGGISSSNLGLTIGGAGNVTVNTTGLSLGTGTLTKDGAGTFTIAAASTFSGAITITAGKLQIGAGSTTGSVGAGAISNAGTLEISRSDDLSFDNVISGAGAFIKSGDGALTLSGANDYTGATTVSAGVLIVGDDSALGTSAGATSVTSGAELRLQGGRSIASEAVTLNGAGISSGGALRNFTGTNALGGAVTLASASRINSDAGTLTLTGGISSTNLGLTIGGAGNVTIDTLGLSLGSGSLTKDGAGTLLLSVANTYSGGTTISGGILRIGIAGALGSQSVLVNSNATLDLNGVLVSNAITISGTGSVIGGQSVADAPTTGTVNNVLTGSDGITKSDAGNLVLTTPNFFSGATQVTGADAVIKAAFLSDASSSLGVSDLTNPDNLIIGGGATLEFTGETNTSTARSFTIAGAGTIAATGTGTLQFNSSSEIKLTGDNPVLELFADNAGVNRFESVLAAGSGLIDTLKIDGTGQWVLGGAVNRFRGDVRVDVNGGTFGFESGSLNDLATGAEITVANGATLAWAGTNTKDVSDYLNVPAGTAKLDLGSNVVEMASVPTMGAGSSLSVIGGTLKVTVNSSTKFTDTAGTLIVNGTVGDVALSGTGILGGSGTVGDVTTVSGSVISPGNSPDTLTFTNWAPAGGTIIDWEVLNAGPSRVAGTDYDTIRVTGNLDLAGVTSINRIMIKVTSLDTISTDGPALNFNSPDAEGMMPRTFTLMTIEGSILNQSGSISDLFAFDFNDFDHTNLGAVNPNYWSVSSFEVGGDTQLIITAVPEPSTYGFGLGALALAAAAIRRRRKLKAEKKA